MFPAGLSPHLAGVWQRKTKSLLIRAIRVIRGSNCRFQVQCNRPCRVCRPAGAGDPYSRGTHGSRRGLLSFGPPGLKRPGTRFGAPVGPRRVEARHAALHPSDPGLGHVHVVGLRRLPRAETQGRGERGRLSVAVTSHPAGPILPFSCLPQRLFASAPLREMSAAWIRFRRCGGSGRFGLGSGVASTAMRLVHASGSDPG
jgi:hypothetical protein